MTAPDEDREATLLPVLRRILIQGNTGLGPSTLRVDAEVGISMVEREALKRVILSCYYDTFYGEESGRS